MWYLYVLVQNPHLNIRRLELLSLPSDMSIAIEYSTIICSISSAKFISFFYILKWFKAILRIRLETFGEYRYAQLLRKMYRTINTLRVRNISNLIFYAWKLKNSKRLCSNLLLCLLLRDICWFGWISWFFVILWSVSFSHRFRLSGIGLSDEMTIIFQKNIFSNFQDYHTKNEVYVQDKTLRYIGTMQNRFLNLDNFFICLGYDDLMVGISDGTNCFW